MCTKKVKSMLPLLLGLVAAMGPRFPRMTTPDHSKNKQWHDPERVAKAKRKRAMRNAKRLGQSKLP